MKYPNERALDVLRDHALDCEQCTAASPPLSEIDRLLSTHAALPEAPGLSAILAAGARPVLAARAARTFRRRVLSRLVLAVAPLPILAAFSAYMLQLTHQLLSTVLPQGMAAYLVGGYAAVLLLLTGATYASIPVLMERREPAVGSLA